ncbi:MAG: hypothetical protein IT495_14035, partial [Gammaproteobacteria bacterium]|nr:hypothetical protein [Gammaproteobacteria bacterium]
LGAGDAGVVALYRSRSDLTQETRYLHRDHLDSITAVTDEAGAPLEALSYDAHGKRRNPDWTDAAVPLSAATTDRGYTGHEHLDEVGLIHRNGRIYDPTLGRMVSADPFVQFPGNLQAYNRYAYVLNNPLSFTDPSGYGLFGFFKKIFKGVKKLVRAAFSILPRKIRPFAAIAVAIVLHDPTIVGAWESGFAAGLVASGGDLESGIIGALTAGAFHQAETFVDGLNLSGFADTSVRALAHGMVGGIAGEVQGGDFLAGFAAAGFHPGAVAGHRAHRRQKCDTDRVHPVRPAARGGGGAGGRRGGGARRGEVRKWGGHRGVRAVVQ